MKKYILRDGIIHIKKGSLSGDIICSIPATKSNDRYKDILKEVARGDSVIIDYVPQDSEKWDHIRQKRTQLLTMCDWRMLFDIKADQKWLDYRQKLRDLPASNDDPDKIVWPEPPGE